MSHLSSHDSDGEAKVQCLECEVKGVTSYYHRLDAHLKAKHGISRTDYLTAHPGAPTISAKAARRVVAKPSVGVAGGVNPNEPKSADPSKPAVPKPFIFRCGVQLHRRDDLKAYDKAFVPAHDPHWQVGARELDKMEAIAVALDDGENVFDVGPTGCGKTAGVYQLAAALNQPVRKIPLSGDARVADFFGTMVVEVDEKTGQSVTLWRDGVFTEAMRKGHWILLDEIDACPPAILFSLHSVLEKGGHLTLAGNGGEVVNPHPEFRVFATANTLGRGDDTGLYTGTNILNEAFLDRFGVVVMSDYPEAATETDILVKKSSVSKARAAKMVEVARRVREAAANEQLYCTFSTRRLLAWATKTVKLKNVHLAADVTVLNKLNREDRAVVAGLIQRHIGKAR
jgi:cobaltochelatase CobS